jgi:hypothetical protein
VIIVQLPAKFLAFRYLVLLPMAFCIAVIIASQSQEQRLLSVIGLIILEQLRDWSLLAMGNEMNAAKSKINKP